VVAATVAVADQAADATNIHQNSPSSADQERPQRPLWPCSLVEGLIARFISERVSASRPIFSNRVRPGGNGRTGKQQAIVFQCQRCRYQDCSLNQVERMHDLRLLKEVRCAAAVLFMLAASVNILAAQQAAAPVGGSPAQDPAKVASSPPVQKSSEPFSFPDFTAIQKIATRGGPGTLLMKVYFSGSTVRVDVSPKITNLFVTSAGKVYKMVTAPDKTSSCVVMTRDQRGFMTSPFERLQGAKVERTPAGTDVVDGSQNQG
jgi:hypothetical protein